MSTSSQPSVVLIMCDDLGYGDTGFNGNTIIRTPCLDAMRSELAAFVDSCRRSHHGADYPAPYTPVGDFQEPTGGW